MGWSLSWLAVENGDVNDFVGEGLYPGTRLYRTNEFTDFLDDQVGAAQLDNGWAVLVVDKDDIPESFIAHLKPKQRQS